MCGCGRGLGSGTHSLCSSSQPAINTDVQAHCVCASIPRSIFRGGVWLLCTLLGGVQQFVLQAHEQLAASQCTVLQYRHVLHVSVTTTHPTRGASLLRLCLPCCTGLLMLWLLLCGCPLHTQPTCDIANISCNCVFVMFECMVSASISSQSL